MNLKHKVRIYVTSENDEKKLVVSGGEARLRSRLLERILGRDHRVLILSLGASVADVEIAEMPKGGDTDAT